MEEGSHAPRIIIAEEVEKSFLWAYFDGACSENGDCGRGVVLYINANPCFKLHIGFGRGTNNYAKLLNLKILLLFSIEGVQTTMRNFATLKFCFSFSLKNIYLVFRFLVTP